MPQGRLILRAASGVLTALAVAFVAWNIHALIRAEGSSWPTELRWTVFAFSCIAYASALVFVAAGWLLLIFAEPRDRPISARRSFRIYAVSQLYKYLPGNVLQFVGRHVELRRIGLSHSAATVGSVGEIILLPAAALCVAVAARQSLLLIDHWAVTVAASLAVIVGLAVAVRFAPPLLARLRPIAGFIAIIGSPRFAVAAFASSLCYVVFFLISGAVFAALAMRVGDWTLADVPTLLAIWSGCWALGFVTPGLPGGIGIREALLTAALTAAGQAEGAVVVALMMRIITLSGDLLFAAFGWAAMRDAFPHDQTGIVSPR